MKASLRYLIVPDSFKDCLPAIEVGKRIEEGILNACPNAYTKVIPLSDGGIGFIDAILYSVKGTKVPVMVSDPLLRTVESYIGLINHGETAIIEMAAASGLELLLPHERNPWITSSYGTGQLMLKALDLGCKEIIVGVGGSATNDGGMGMAKALGINFYDEFGKELDEGGGVLGKLVYIDSTHVDTRISKVTIKAAADVSNRLCGSEGASLVYGAQKGAKSIMANKLEANMQHFAMKLDAHYKTKTNLLIGGGAAGGLAAGLAVFFNAELISGFTLVSQLTQLEKYVTEADVLYSAEGAVDRQTKFGKTPAGVGKLAQIGYKPLYVFTGIAPDAINELQNLGITAVIPIIRRPVSLEEAIQLAPSWISLSSEMVTTIIGNSTNFIESASKVRAHY